MWINEDGTTNVATTCFVIPSESARQSTTPVRMVQSRPKLLTSFATLKSNLDGALGRIRIARGRKLAEHAGDFRQHSF